MSADFQSSNPNRGLKCGSCRRILILQEHRYWSNPSDPSLWSLDPEGLPDFIHQFVEQSGWTKGKISCPCESCQHKIGTFDFVGAARDPVHIVKSKVDEYGAENPVIAAAIERRSGGQEGMEAGTSAPYPRFGESSDSEGFDSRDHCRWSTTSSSLEDAEADEDDEPRANVLEVDMVLSQGDYRLVSRRSRRRRLKVKMYRKTGKKRRITFEEKREKDQKFIQDILNAEPELDKIDPSLICPVCLDLLHDPHAAIPCKHIFCETCLRRLGSKNAMDTLCPMCRQQIVFCEEQKDLGENIKHQFNELYCKRKTFERSSPNIFTLPLPWRPGWRNLMSGRPLGGNQFDGQTTSELIARVVQQLPYYIPPVVLANLVNLVFFVFLLFAVEVVPLILSLFMKKPLSPNLTRNLEASKGMSVRDMAAKAKIEEAIAKAEYEFPTPEGVSPVIDTTFYYALYVTVLCVSFIGNFIFTKPHHPPRENRQHRYNIVHQITTNRTLARMIKSFWFSLFIGVVCLPVMITPILFEVNLESFNNVGKVKTVLNFLIQIMVSITDFFTSYYGIPVIAALVAFLF